MESKTRVSQSAIKAQLEAIAPLLSEIRKNVEQMIDCPRKKSILLTVERLEQKTAIAQREISEDKVMDYVNRHPEVLQKLAKFARSDEGAKEVSVEVVTPEDIASDEGSGNDGQKKSRRQKK